LNKWFCLQQKLKKGGLAEERRQRAAKDRGTGKSRVIGRQKKLAKCYGRTSCHRHDHHKEIATIVMDRPKDAEMEKQLQTAQQGPATKVLKSSAKDRRKK
jgi:hypothetical protein